MQNINTYPWLSNFKDTLTPHASFLNKMGMSLEAMADKVLGEGSLNSAFLMPPVPQAYVISSHGQGIYSLDGDLVIDGFGYRVQVCWEYRGENDLSDLTQPIDSDKLNFWWCQLPIQEILKEQNKTFVLPFDTSSLSFSLVTPPLVLPHVLFNVHLNNQATNEAVSKLKEQLSELQSDWNESNGESAGLIHGVSEVSLGGKNSISFKMDVGNGGWEALEYVLQVLSESEVKITKIKLGNY